MTKEQAKKELLNGYKIGNKEWFPYEYIYFDEKNLKLKYNDNKDAFFEKLYDEDGYYIWTVCVEEAEEDIAPERKYFINYTVFNKNDVTVGKNIGNMVVKISDFNLENIQKILFDSDKELYESYGYDTCYIQSICEIRD